MMNLRIIAACLFVGACAAPDPALETSLPTGHPRVSAPPLSDLIPPPRIAAVGAVLETMDSGGYTYARVAVGDRELWVAGPPSDLEVGQSIRLQDAVSMGEFTSESLGWTFDELYFVGGFQAEGLRRGDSSLAEPSPESTSGVVEEVLSGGGYTYVLAHVADALVWLAGPETTVEKGQTVTWTGGTEMGEFRSPTLKRTFENILFVREIRVER